MRILHFYFSRKFYILLSSDLIFSDFSETQTTVSQNAPPPLCRWLFVVIRCKISLTILLSNKNLHSQFFLQSAGFPPTLGGDADTSCLLSHRHLTLLFFSQTTTSQPEYLCPVFKSLPHEESLCD